MLFSRYRKDGNSWDPLLVHIQVPLSDRHCDLFASPGLLPGTVESPAKTVPGINNPLSRPPKGEVPGEGSMKVQEDSTPWKHTLTPSSSHEEDFSGQEGIHICRVTDTSSNLLSFSEIAIYY